MAVARQQQTDEGSPVGDKDPVIAAAAAGDQSAWDVLVDRHAQELWDLARGFGLDTATAAAVCQFTWMRLVDHLDELSTDGQLRDWLSSTAQRQSRADPLPRPRGWLGLLG